VFDGRAPDGHALLTTFVGGARRPELAHESFDALADRAATAVRALLGARGAPAFVHVTRWAPGIPQYDVGHDAALDAAMAVERSCAGLTLAGSWRRGVSLGDCIADGLAAGTRAVTVADRGARASGRAVVSVR
jgi:oxygen-dependent protoporphyrinogen oxidase